MNEDTNLTPALPSPSLALTGRFAPDQARRYVHVPFNVPMGVQQIHLCCSYNDRIGSDPTLDGGNTLDIGLFDERGTAGGGLGFRGWSGSELLVFTIGDTWATPPYRSGPIGSGTWHVLLGPYKIGPRGLDYRIDVFFNLGLLPERRSPSNPVFKRPSLLPPAESGWVRGDLHCHTRHSDGDSWPEEVLAAAAAAGLDFLGITDHNAALPHVTPPPGMGLPLLVPGVEVTTYGGHWNAWGGGSWYDFREATTPQVEAAMRRAAADGAFVSVNHPRPFGPDWHYPDATGFHAIEIWNGPWFAFNAVALGVWDAHLRQGSNVVAVGGSDTHRLRPDPDGYIQPRLGQPTTWVRIGGAALSVPSLLAALKHGDSFVSATPNGPQLYLSWLVVDSVQVRVVRGQGAVLSLLSETGCIMAMPVIDADTTVAWQLASSPRYVRAQVMDTAGNALAISNPLWSPIDR